MKNIFVSLMLLVLGLCAQTSLFQVTDQAGKKVLDVTSNGLIILNPNSTADTFDDTLMIITNTQIKTFVDGTANKGLARSVSVVSTASGKAIQSSLMSLRPENYFIGHESGAEITTGTKNTFLGYQTGKLNSTGLSNIFIGNLAGQANTVGKRNIFIGDQAGYANIGNASSTTIGHDNIYIGTQTGKINSVGEHNTMIGSYNGYNAASGNRNTFIGAFNGFNATGANNTTLGVDAGRNLSTGSENTYLGAGAASNEGATGPGVGSRNTFIGYCSGFSNKGDDNVFLGYRAGQSEAGSDKLYIANTATTTPLIKGNFPNGALEFNTSGLYINNPAAAVNMYLDSYNSTSNSNLIFQNSGTNKGYLGYNFGSEYLYLYEGGYVTLQGGSLGINNLAPGQKLDISGGNGRVQSGFSWLTSSDIRYKTNVTTLSGSLNKIQNIRGVRYDLKEDKEQINGIGKHIGVIAQEIEKEFPEFVVTDKDGYKSVSYDKISAVLIEAVKELNNKNKLLEEKNKQLENDVIFIKAMLKK